MPSGQPFTSLCQQLARGRHADRADLHLHSTCSDGTYSPAQLVELARLCGLQAIALTDHDTLAGVDPAREAARGSGLEIIAGVEISSEYRGRELHLLAYFVRPDDGPLCRALATVRSMRQERFQEMVRRLQALGVSVDVGESDSPNGPDSLGRRHLAELLVCQGRVSSIREAFTRYLGERGPVAVPKVRIPAAEALSLVRGAGGVAAWAHPAYDCTAESLAELRSLGLGALEVHYPDTRPARALELRSWAKALGLAISGGSDCHGPGKRGVGACTVSAEELELLRRLARGGTHVSRAVRQDQTGPGPDA
jgi:predicted metal-dependent phosphoesterase TrpH